MANEDRKNRMLDAAAVTGVAILTHEIIDAIKWCGAHPEEVGKIKARFNGNCEILRKNFTK